MPRLEFFRYVLNAPLLQVYIVAKSNIKVIFYTVPAAFNWHFVRSIHLFTIMSIIDLCFYSLLWLSGISFTIPFCLNFIWISLQSQSVFEKIQLTVEVHGGLTTYVIYRRCAHFDMCIFTLNWSTLTPVTHFVQFQLKVASYFSPGAKKEHDTGNEAAMKIHKKIKIGIPEIGTFSAITAKVYLIWSWNFGVIMRKIWVFIWHQIKYYFRLSPGGWECKGNIPL